MKLMIYPNEVNVGIEDYAKFRINELVKEPEGSKKGGAS